MVEAFTAGVITGVAATLAVATGAGWWAYRHPASMVRMLSGRRRKSRV